MPHHLSHKNSPPEAFRIGESNVLTANQDVAQNLYKHPTRFSQARPLEFETRLQVHRYPLLELRKALEAPKTSLTHLGTGQPAVKIYTGSEVSSVVLNNTHAVELTRSPE
ncbi:hypothetical protein MTO96_025037 [Rhipicephalus appendiculatus]